MTRPFLLTVHGDPCTGKTTLATRLARELGCTLLAKDDFKEALFNERGTGDRAWSRELSELAWERLFAAAMTALAAGHGVIVEGNLRFPEHEARVSALVRASGAACAQVLCLAGAQVLRERRRERARRGTRHPGHLDAVLATEEPAGRSASAMLAGVPVFTWDTTPPHAPDYGALVGWLRAMRGGD